MMLVPVILALAVETGLDLTGLPPDVAEFAEEASEWLLEGRDLPRDYRIRLLQMPPDERLQAIVFLRRSGLLTTSAWPLDDLLRPAPQDGETAK